VRAAARLGLRLFWTTSEQRRRSLLVIVVTALGELAMLTVFAIAAAGMSTPGAQSNAPADKYRLALAIVLAISLPVLTLAASVARFSAALRDRRLANLRLLGLSPSRTRVVAAVEIGVSAVVGTLIGVLVFAALRLPIARLTLRGWEWSPDAFTPHVAGWLLGAIAVPLVAVAAAALPQRLDAAAAMAAARRAERRRPSWWRVLPLVVGLAICLGIDIRYAHANYTNSSADLLVAGIAITGIGVLLVVPVFVRLLADLVLRTTRRPSLLIAARRMQAQPAGISRVIAALLVGLFVVSGARLVLAAFESTPQYVTAERALHHEQIGTTQGSARLVDRARTRVEGLDGVREVAGFGSLQAMYPVAGADDRWSANVLIGTCAELLRVAPRTTGCSDDRAAWVGVHEGSPKRLSLVTDSEKPVGVMAAPSSEFTIDPAFQDSMWTDVFVPVKLAPAAALQRAHHTLVVVAGPGRAMTARLAEAGVDSWPDYETYDFVSSLRAILWSISIAVLSVGLLAFAVSGIDRALARRRELASLQILGTPPGVLRQAQWWEAALPTAMGAVLAIGTGWIAGLSYLQLDRSVGRTVPWTSMTTLGVTALVAALVVAALTVVATNVRLSADLIRTE